MSTKQHRRKCDWSTECDTPATILGAKGYLYCAEHRENRRGVEATRVLKKWEMVRIEDGLPLVSWTASRTETAAHDAAVIAQAAASVTAEPPFNSRRTSANPNPLLLGLRRSIERRYSADSIRYSFAACDANPPAHISRVHIEHARKVFMRCEARIK